MDVTINGTRYVPATTQQPRFGVGITTQNRNDVLARCLTYWHRHTPDNVPIVIVDDASDKPVDGADYRFDDVVGVAAAKNKALELLAAAGVTHYFLADDDCYPLTDGWWQPYIDSPEPHLMRIFEDLSGPKKLHDITRIYNDGHHVAYTGARGCLLYIDQHALDTVGGMDAATFGRWGFEHVDWSCRIHNAGLTTWRYADVAGSDKLIHCMDEHEQVTRTVPTADRQQLAKRNAAIHNERRDAGCRTYVEYREQRNVVLTHLLTAEPDPQRGKRWTPKADTITTWAHSIRGADAIVLTDRDLIGDPAPATTNLVPVARGHNAYRARWTHSYQWLRAHPEVQWIWCTDGSDVEMLTPPWDHMTPGTLYVGSEPKVLDDSWMRKAHNAKRYQYLMNTQPRAQLLNCGLAGGDRATMLELLHHMVTEFDDLAAERFWKVEPPGREVGDMGAFNRVVHTHFADRYATGPMVHTVFKAEERNTFSWWKHR